MSDATIVLNAEVRTDSGKGASRRLRHEDKVPAIIYGGGKDAQSITLEHSKLLKAQTDEAFYSHIITIQVGKEKVKAIVKAMQRHPFKPKIMHVDFQRVEAGHELKSIIAIHLINEEAAVKKGGIVVRGANEVEITCLPKDLPDAIEVDVSEMAIGTTIHLSDIKAPKGVSFTQLTKGEGHDIAIVSVNKPGGKAVTEDTEEEETDTPE
ncbi:50S ribosomal protein L25/general stress protein Ctc [Rheinheimera sp. WS51]|uniref:50S ribosomal protein L25/general stress protein Ctc n=1 Tax=Rheinheimera sp. WS51 TaxID=3425886 RepID=UPI003D8FB03F